MMDTEPDEIRCRHVVESGKKRPIFVCYRQLDGLMYARWMYSALKEALASKNQEMAIYFDRTAPALGDWTAAHGTALESAGSLVFICTPGSFSDQGKKDWVHRELDWWLENRNTPPIL